MLGAKALQGSQIVAVAQYREQILQDPPIAIAGLTSVGAFEVVLQILLHAVVIEQRVIDVYQEDNRMNPYHSELGQCCLRCVSRHPLMKAVAWPPRRQSPGRQRVPVNLSVLANVIA